MDSNILTREQVADFLGVKPKTLANWAAQGKGPAIYKPATKVVFYEKDEVLRWIRTNGAPAPRRRR